MSIRGYKFGRYANAPEIRLVDPATGARLHMSGRGVAQHPAYAWIGTRAQARELRRRALDAGEPWPWRPVNDVADSQGYEELEGM